MAGFADQCIQRTALDNVCAIFWYEYLDCSADDYLTKGQAQRLFKLYEDIADVRIHLRVLNQQSLIKRHKH